MKRPLDQAGLDSTDAGGPPLGSQSEIKTLDKDGIEREAGPGGIIKAAGGEGDVGVHHDAKRFKAAPTGENAPAPVHLKSPAASGPFGETRTGSSTSGTSGPALLESKKEISAEKSSSSSSTTAGGAAKRKSGASPSATNNKNQNDVGATADVDMYV